MRSAGVVIVLIAASMFSPGRLGHHGEARRIPSAVDLSAFRGALSSPAPVRAPSRVDAKDTPRGRQLAARKRRPNHRRTLRVAERAVERTLLRIAPHTRPLARFVDHTTGLVKRNVAARCRRLRKGGRHRAARFLCRVWQAPRRPMSGVAVIYRTRRHRVVVTAYRPRRKS